MGRTLQLVFIGVASAASHALAGSAREADAALFHIAAPNDPWDLRPWTEPWSRADMAELPSLSASVPSVPLIYRQDMYPMVPLPPALMGTAALGAGWLALRGLRFVRRARRRMR